MSYNSSWFDRRLDCLKTVNIGSFNSTCSYSSSAYGRSTTGCFDFENVILILNKENWSSYHNHTTNKNNRLDKILLSGFEICKFVHIVGRESHTAQISGPETVHIEWILCLFVAKKNVRCNLAAVKHTQPSNCF